MSAFEPFERRPRLAIAVSGGSDSLALCCLADRWTRQRDGKVVALTVDHRLRAGSGTEATQVGGWLNDRGIEHLVLQWTPQGRSQQAARDGRYELLTRACRDTGILHLLTGHTADDQAETVAFRWSRNSGPDGLSGMAVERELDQVRLLRPLLPIGRNQLRATLKSRRQPWIDDPTNSDVRYARPQLRRRLASRPTAPLLWQRRANREAKRRKQRDLELNEILARWVAVHAEGYATADLGMLDLPNAAALLGRIVRTVRGSAHLPPQDKLAKACEALQSGAPGQTIGGCHIAGGPRLVVVREPARITEFKRVRAGETVRWDRRFAVTAPLDGVVASLGDAARAVEWQSLPAMARRALPALWLDRDLVGLPTLGMRRDSADSGLETRLQVRFRPPQPLAGAAFGGILGDV